MERSLDELTHMAEASGLYEIYRHCMFLPTREKFDKKIALFLRDDSVKILVCRSHGKAVGVIVLSFAAPGSMEIAGIAVDPAARGQGVGSHMIRQAVRRYRPRHVCAETDDDAVGFYRKNGFRAAAFSEMRGGEAAVRYRCEWSPPRADEC